MGNQAVKAFIRFASDLRAIDPGCGPVLVREGAQPHELTLFEFCAARYPSVVDQICACQIGGDAFDRLAQEHSGCVLDAIGNGLDIPVKVLREYRFRHKFFKPIKRYCRARRIDLDA